MSIRSFSLASFRTRAQNVYYGWVMVVALAIVGAVIIAMGGINFGLFITPMADELGIRQAYFGWAQSARFIGFAVTASYIGRLLDRAGARWPLAAAGLLSAVVMVGMAFVNAGWQVVALFSILGMIGLQGAGGNLFTSVPLAKWFVRNRGKAMSMAFLGIPAGIFVFSPLSDLLITNLGWRASWAIIGTGGGLLICVIAVAFVRRQPEDMCLLPDGATAGPPLQAGGVPPRPDAGEYSWTRSEAIHTTTFWRLAVAFGMRMFAFASLGLFRIPYYIESGVSSQAVALALSAEAVTSVMAAVPVGWAIDRVPTRFVVAIPCSALAGSILVTINISETWHVFAATMLFGMGAASFAVIENTIWPQYFGGRSVGAVRGAALPLVTVFAAAGAPIAGTFKDVTGSFVPVWWASLVILGVVLALILVTPKPERRISGPQPST